MVHEDLRPSKILSKNSFRNCVAAAAALGASSNCPIHLVAIARHAGIEHSLDDWQEVGPSVPLLVDMQPAGRWLGERFYRGGGVPAVMRELLDAGVIDGNCMTVTGKTYAENLAKIRKEDTDREVIRAYDKPMLPNAGYVVMGSNFFESAVMKMSVVDAEFRKRFLSEPGRENVFEGKAFVFEGPEDYHKRIEDPRLAIPAQSILIIRNCGPVGYPGSAEGKLLIRAIEIKFKADLFIIHSRQHAASGIPPQTRYLCAPHARRWPAIRNLWVSFCPQCLTRSGYRRRPRASQNWGHDQNGPQQTDCRCPFTGRRDGEAEEGMEAAGFAEPDAVGGDVSWDGRAVGDRWMLGGCGQVCEGFGNKGRSEAQPLIGLIVQNFKNVMLVLLARR